MLKVKTKNKLLYKHKYYKPKITKKHPHKLTFYYIIKQGNSEHQKLKDYRH